MTTDGGDRPLSVALLGYGLAGRVFHAPLIRTTPGLRLSAVVTSDPARAAQASADVPGVTVLESDRAVWEDAGSYDLVVVATANIAHVPQATATLRAGLPVVVDKPVAADAEQTSALIELAAERGLGLHAFQNRRWDSDVLTVREVLESGAIGAAHRLESRIERWRPQPRGVWRESAAPEAMGGQLYDLGVHAIDQALMLLGPVARVTATARPVRDPLQADDDAVVVLEHVSGAVSILTVSAVSALPGPRFRVLGTRGALLIEAADSQEDALRQGRTPDQPGWGQEPESSAAVLASPGPDGTDVVTNRPLTPGRWQQFYAGVRDSIRHGGPGPVLPESVLATMRVLDAARLSRGRTVDLG